MCESAKGETHSTKFIDTNVAIRRCEVDSGSDCSQVEMLSVHEARTRGVQINGGYERVLYGSDMEM